MPVSEWTHGHVDPWWGTHHRELEYHYFPYRDTDTIDLWRSQGYNNSNFGGGIYSMSRGLPTWAEKFQSMFEDWMDTGIAIYSMKTGDLLPNHSDHYSNYLRMFNVRAEDVWRAVVFLEDWQSGHYFEIDKKPRMPWRAGDWVCWNNDVPHSAANLGIQTRYTVQITGTKK